MSNESHTTFWMVKGDGPTNQKHRHLIDARKEAERLARMKPGEEFFVLEAVSVSRSVDVETIQMILPPPF